MVKTFTYEEKREYKYNNFVPNTTISSNLSRIYMYVISPSPFQMTQEIYCSHLHLEVLDIGPAAFRIRPTTVR